MITITAIFQSLSYFFLLVSFIMYAEKDKNNANVPVNKKPTEPHKVEIKNLANYRCLF